MHALAIERQVQFHLQKNLQMRLPCGNRQGRALSLFVYSHISAQNITIRASYIFKLLIIKNLDRKNRRIDIFNHSTKRIKFFPTTIYCYIHIFAFNCQNFILYFIQIQNFSTHKILLTPIFAKR